MTAPELSGSERHRSVGDDSTVPAKVLVLFPLGYTDLERRLEAAVEVVRPRSLEEADLIEAIDDVDAVLTRSSGVQLTEEVIRAGRRLALICTVAAGTDNIDLNAAARAGVRVSHGTGVAPLAVAEYVIGAMVAGHRRMLDAQQALLDGTLDWTSRVVGWQGFELTGSTLGIVGFGHIGRLVARMARAAFGVRILVHDPAVTSNEPDVEVVEDLAALLSQSQTVTLHVPLLPSTRGMIGRNELRLIGQDGVLVHAARGGVVDERALADALLAQELKAAVVDVFATEPPERADLGHLAGVPGLIMTPHIAGVTDKAFRALALSAVDRLLAHLQATAV